VNGLIADDVAAFCGDVADVVSQLLEVQGVPATPARVAAILGRLAERVDEGSEETNGLLRLRLAPDGHGGLALRLMIDVAALWQDAERRTVATVFSLPPELRPEAEA
jgi:hypothetical protein